MNCCAGEWYGQHYRHAVDCTTIDSDHRRALLYDPAEEWGINASDPVVDRSTPSTPICPECAKPVLHRADKNIWTCSGCGTTDGIDCEECGPHLWGICGGCGQHKCFCRCTIVNLAHDHYGER